MVLLTVVRSERPGKNPGGRLRGAPFAEDQKHGGRAACGPRPAGLLFFVESGSCTDCQCKLGWAHAYSVAWASCDEELLGTAAPYKV